MSHPHAMYHRAIECSHAFRDSSVCIFCGWHPPMPSHGQLLATCPASRFFSPTVVTPPQNNQVLLGVEAVGGAILSNVINGKSLND